jgi:hypothetical protein
MALVQLYRGIFFFFSGVCVGKHDGGRLGSGILASVTCIAQAHPTTRVLSGACFFSSSFFLPPASGSCFIADQAHKACFLSSFFGKIRKIPHLVHCLCTDIVNLEMVSGNDPCKLLHELIKHALWCLVS